MPHETGRADLAAPYRIDYHLRRGNPGLAAPRLALLLHGYTQSSESIYSKLDPILPPQYTVLAPNGLFPIPEVRSAKDIRLGFSWYFHDHRIDEYFIDMKPAVQILGELIDSLDFGDLPTTVIGFSQGGYLAPFLAAARPGIDQVIGIGARYLDDEIAGEVGYRVDGIHGAADSVVDAKLSRAAHGRLDARSRVPGGRFIVIDGLEHRIDSSVQEEVAKLVLT